MIFNNSQEVITLIEKKTRNGIALRKFKDFMESIGNPQFKLKCIHIGGTNGKGSTTNTLCSILIEAGYKVGSFTSPYLETHHDRIRINNVFIDDKNIVEYANEYYDKWVEYDLSMFEIDMFIATKYFVDHNVDYALFEVGLGGECDATNIINPLVSAITNIGLDHMQYLGNTYEAIAKTKGGIIKEGKAFITSEKKENCLAIFKTICEEKNSEMMQCKEARNSRVEKELIFDYGKYKNIKQPTLAMYQVMNTTLAITIIDYLREHKLVELSDTQLYEGIHKAIWKGRFEVLSEKPFIIVDGAHNNEGVKALVDTCKGYKKIKILFSALEDKPKDTMLEQLLALSKDVCVCEFDFPRAAKAKDIAGNYPVKVIPDYKEAIQYMLDYDGLILICGSLYFISVAREYIKKELAL